jgi:hypothetical protein
MRFPADFVRASVIYFLKMHFPLTRLGISYFPSRCAFPPTRLGIGYLFPQDALSR